MAITFRIPNPSRVATHESFLPHVSFEIHLRSAASGSGISLPPLGVTSGIIRAIIRQGRWVVLCPSQGCTEATVASGTLLAWCCPVCGSPENGGRWYEVLFPPGREAIEALLVKRTVDGGGKAMTRNWEDGETLQALRDENLAHGIPD